MWMTGNSKKTGTPLRRSFLDIVNLLVLFIKADECYTQKSLQVLGKELQLPVY